MIDCGLVWCSAHTSTQKVVFSTDKAVSDLINIALPSPVIVSIILLSSYPLILSCSCACALPLQPLLLLRDIKLHTFHSVLIIALEEVISSDKPGQASMSNGKAEQLAGNKGYGGYGRTVNNSTDIYKFKSIGSKSAADQLREARTRSLEAYLRILKSFERPSTAGGDLPPDTHRSVTPGEGAYMMSVRQALYCFILSIGSETVMLDLPVSRTAKDAPAVARGVAAVMGSGMGTGMGISSSTLCPVSVTVSASSMRPQSKLLEDSRSNLLLSIHS